MAGFVQIVEYDTSRIDEVKALGEEMQAQGDPGPVRRVTVVADRDRPNHYSSIIEFDSYDDAMANNDRPQTMEFAGKMMQLCDGPPTFHNLDVVHHWES
jgi:hypothetical protein